MVVADLERELLALKREEDKLVKDIKAAAKVGNQAGMRVLAKSLVRLRGQQTKLQASMAQLRGVKTSITVTSLLFFHGFPPFFFPATISHKPSFPPHTLFVVMFQSKGRVIWSGPLWVPQP